MKIMYISLPVILSNIHSLTQHKEASPHNFFAIFRDNDLLTQIVLFDRFG